MSDLDHLAIHRGSVVEPRHLSLVVSNTWPDEDDIDIYDDEPIRQAVKQPVDVWSALTLIGLGAFIVACIWFKVGGV